MLELIPKIPVNIKRRAVSAVRTFPKGCGFKVNSKPSPSPPIQLERNSEKSSTVNATNLEANESIPSVQAVPKPAPVKDSESLGAEAQEGIAEDVVKIKDLDQLEAISEEGLKVNGHVAEEPSSSKKCENEVLVVEEPESADKYVGGDVERLVDSTEICVNGDVEVLRSLEKRYGGEVEGLENSSKRLFVKKKRKVAVVREFPPECGRGVPRILSKGADSGGDAATSSESKVSGNRTRSSDKDDVINKDEEAIVIKSPAVENLNGNKTKPVDGVSSSKLIPDEDEGKTSQQASRKVSKDITLQSSKGKSLYLEKRAPVEEVAEVEESNQTKGKAKEVSKEITVKSPKTKGLVAEKKKIVETEDSSAGTAKAEGKSDGSSQTQVKANEVHRKSIVNSAKMKSLDREKKPLMKPKSEVEGSVTVQTAAIVESEVKKNDIKRIKEDAQESSSEVQVKSLLKGSSSMSKLEDHSNKKMLTVHSSRKTLEGHEVKQVGKIQAKGSQRPGSSSRKDNVDRNLVGKPLGARSIKSLMHVNPLKRKLPDEADDESLEAYGYGDRLVVQALMAAENCPWRNGRKSSGSIPRSATPRFKVNKERKLMGSKSAFISSIVSSSQHKSTEDMEDDEDSLPQVGANENALTIYNSSRELSVNMTPSVPDKPFSKGSSSSSEEAANRKRVKKALRLFQLVCRKLLQGEEAKSKDQGKMRVDLEASRILKESKEWVHHGKTFIGEVPGVEVGDEFHYRVELAIIGIHRPFQGGIDFTNVKGKSLATSIVASGGYPDDVDDSDVLIYSGSGGSSAGGADKQAADQKLERGNLALKNSMDDQSPVRVIYGCKEKSDSRDARAKMISTFTYDGLYLVEKYWLEKGPNGYNVFKFQLRRKPGQPEIALKELKKTKKSKVREGLCVKDISDGKENISICAVNTVDNDQPPRFKYITKVIYPSWCSHKPPRGCDCMDGCSDSEKCACAVKNGGEIPFNFNGAIVQAKALIFECGPSCKCPPSCHNRVSQHGIKLPLEIFKTKTRGWGVRSLYSIPSGTFICEYIGEMLEDAEAEQRFNDEYLFDIGHNYDDHALWDGLPSIIPGMQSSAACETVENVGFTIDAAEYGNVGRFINHSCSPNLYAQNVLYDHDDKRMPHIMFFAIDNIPPLQELTYHYNYTVDQVRDSEGNIKKKECYCGSPECTGRLY